MTRFSTLKLIHNSFEYLKTHTHKDVTYWRCAKSREVKCKAVAHTKGFNGKQMVKLNGFHIHQGLID